MFPARPGRGSSRFWRQVRRGAGGDDGRHRGSTNDGTMILEHACLDVRPGEETCFEQSFAVAQGIIASMPGFASLRLERCVEQPSRYLRLVEWERLEDHTEGFRGSPRFGEWRRLLHHFYDPFPVVEHYETVLTA